MTFQSILEQNRVKLLGILCCYQIITHNISHLMLLLLSTQTDRLLCPLL